MTIKEIIKQNLPTIIYIYENGDGVEPKNITQTAQRFCEIKGIEYSDSWRRSLSDVISSLEDTQESYTENKSREKEEFKENLTNETAELTTYVHSPVKSLADLIRVCNIDTEVWDVDRYVCNTWGVTSWKTGKAEYRTNYQVKAWLKKKEKDWEEAIPLINRALESYTPKKINEQRGRGCGVVTVTDLHLGAEVKDLVRTKDFNLEILIEYLEEVALRVNEMGFEEVHLNILGDLFESISGLNHLNTFKSLGQGMWGANVIILANEIIGKHLISRINNLVAINLIGGNHDRMTISKEVDNSSEGASMFAYILKKDFPYIEIDYSPIALTKVIDGINYILFHGDKYISKRELSKVVFDFGDTDYFNIVLEGHTHTRKAKRATKTTSVQYNEYEVVSIDDLRYRNYTVPALFTGNYYSESLGFAGTAGCLVITNNGRNLPIVTDITI